jgi:hypothetical protein
MDSLELLSHHFEEDVLALFKHVLTTTYFCFDGQFYEQTDGVGMGSPLSPVIANFFMEDFEQKVIQQATHKPVCWFRYVDDTFVIWPHGQEKLEDFLIHLPFLDIELYRKMDSSLGHKVYRKSTHTNLYLHQNLHHHPANLASLIHKAKALSDQDSLPQELEFLTTVFKDNGYSHQQIRQAIKLVTQTPPRPMINPPRPHIYLTHKQLLGNSAECWPNIT